jgi:diadenosine tetraphosphate (Ap4A) HIT family hydrolase
VVLKRHAEDLFEITDQEKDELFKVMRSLKSSLKNSFNPDLMNYSSLGNELKHLHIHVIPRYERPVEFAGVTFTDERWGQNPSP